MTPPPTGIFISYRREQAGPQAGRLFDHLVASFGADQVFMDVDSIGLGLDFVQVIEDAVSSCSVLLAVIGSDWLKAADASGQRRIDDPTDFVRVEIETALKRDIRVVPVLLNAAEIPDASLLPRELRALTRRQALRLDDATFRASVSVLIARLEEAFSASRRAAAAQPIAPAEKAPVRAPAAPRRPLSADVIAREPRRLALRVHLGREIHVVEVHIGRHKADWITVNGSKVYETTSNSGLKGESPVFFELSDGETPVAVRGEFDLNWSGQKLTSARVVVDGVPVYSD